MSRFVRQSHYRHVYGQSSKKEACYDNIRVSASGDTNLASANSKYLAVNYQASGGGAFFVAPLSHTGKYPDVYPLARAHTAPVLDTAWSPFDEDLIASCGDDGKVVLTRIQESKLLSALRGGEGKDVEDIEPVKKLPGHTRKAGLVKWHPAASGVLASSSTDVKIWDVEHGVAKVEFAAQPDMVGSMSFNWTGTLLATTCKDKKLRVYDLRAGLKPAQTADSHSGIKGSRVEWMGRLDRICTTGFSKLSERQVFIWDSSDVAKGPVKQLTVDVSSGTLMPFWSDNDVLFLAGKGDGNVRYYEFEADDLHYLTQYSSNEPQRGMCWLPRRALNTSDCEIGRAFKVTNSLVEPISFIVPRKSDTFQNDIYPPAPAAQPALSADAFFSGQTAEPILISLENRQALDQAPPVKSNVYASQPSTPARGQSAASQAQQTPSRQRSLEEKKEAAEGSVAAAAGSALGSESPAPAPSKTASDQAAVSASAVSREPEEAAPPREEGSREPKDVPIPPSEPPSRQTTLAGSSSLASLSAVNGHSTSAGGAGAGAGTGGAEGEEVEGLKRENEKLKEELAERDGLIRSLELQLEKLKTNQRKIAELSAGLV